MSNSPPYDLVIGLDRSDKKADLQLITTATGQRRSVVIDTAPEALWERQCYHHVFGMKPMTSQGTTREARPCKKCTQSE
jgi:hypothetical protein